MRARSPSACSVVARSSVQSDLVYKPEQGRIQKFHLGGHEAPKAPRSSAAGARIEAPQAPRGVGCGEGVSPSPLGEGSGEGAVPPLQNFF